MSVAGCMVGVDDALTVLERVLDELAALPLGSCTDEEVLALWRRLDTLRNRLAPIEHAVIAQVEQRGLPYTHGCASTVLFARQLLRLHPGDAAARVNAARVLGPRQLLTGQPLGPVYPATATAQAGGDISARHAQIIVDTIQSLPDEVAAVLDVTVETILLDAARHHDPHQLAQHARDLAGMLDQDGRYNKLAHRDRTRDVTLHRRPDGSGHLHGEVTAELAEHLHVLFDSLATPTPDADGAKDPRNAAQRRHDALLDLCHLVERAQLLPTITERPGIFRTVNLVGLRC